jgi:hypothetical protein
MTKPSVAESHLIRLTLACGAEMCGACMFLYENSQGMQVETFKCRIFQRRVLDDAGKGAFSRWDAVRLPECLEAERG